MLPPPPLQQERPVRLEEAAKGGSMGLRAAVGVLYVTFTVGLLCGGQKGSMPLLCLLWGVGLFEG